MNLPNVFCILGVLTLVGTLLALRHQRIRTEYSVTWLFVGLLLTGLGQFPQLLEGAADQFGFSRDNTFLLAAGILASVVVFEISHDVSQLRDENVILAQRVAILDFKVREFENGTSSQDS